MPEQVKVGVPENGQVKAHRLVVQRGVFVGMSPIVNDDLYVEFRKGSGERTRHRVALDKGARISTNTYFGRFAASYWQRWTTVTEVEASLRIESEGRFRVRMVASDIAGHRRILETRDGSGSSEVTLASPLDKFVDGGALWIEVDSLDAPMTIDHLEWTVAAPETVRPVSVAICTFNRADDCAETVAALASDATVRDLLSSVYVVDQGNDLVKDRARFTEAADKLGDKLKYLQQPNLGGAGGFSRGLFEATSNGTDLADVILMDDDILCEPETVLRLNAFANMTVEPTLVGAQMMYLLNPDFLNVGAEDVDLKTLHHGQRVPKALINTSMLKKRQERRVDAGYNAWWTCLIPAEVVEAIGLPVPIFFQWDDVEYGIRARKAGFVTVTLPNAAVWHADFYWKDFDDWARYFSTRNSLVVGSLHSDLDTKGLSRQFFRQISEFLVGMQYGLAFTTLKGIEDYLDGPEALRDGGIEAMASIRAGRAQYAETIKHDAATAPVPSNELHTERAGGEPSLMRVILVKRAVDQWLGRTRGGLINIPREDAHWWHISRFDHVVVTDASQSGVRIRQRNKATARALVIRTVKLLRRFQKEAPAVSAKYRAAMPELTSRENWARLYEK
ncbi:glycosyltransferase [Rhodococcus sp. (in: high G+C Gram-positive bacteria)]|uniref:glycosyltransferase n=1 Tax=Rhodococcus sp. TaxID=1831 RepID=UPI001A1E8B5F|nr:glycosyltransferase [Rhodococcus sp. (in: high G+C Gram-positive bacteria)]MBJ7477475.1 glycosyltransferase [Rhodococcus sp. (in: high G+C Gram-positive bacteria)]